MISLIFKMAIIYNVNGRFDNMDLNILTLGTLVFTLGFNYSLFLIKWKNEMAIFCGALSEELVFNFYKKYIA